MNEQRKALVKTIYQALKNGEISKSNKQLLTERELAEKFGEKRLSLREALIVLETMGVIDIRERQGIFIGEGSLETVSQGLELLSFSSPIDIISQVFEVRAIFEPSAAALAAIRRTDRDIALLKNELESMQKIINVKNLRDSPLVNKHNAIFHNLIIAATNNTVLQRIYEGISKLSQDTFTVMRTNLNFNPYQRWPVILQKEHNDLVNAIIKGDSEKAREMSLIHLGNSRSRNHEAIHSTETILQQ